MAYIVKCWIPVESEDEYEIFDHIDEANQECDDMTEMQPENIYQVVGVVKETINNELE